MSHNCTGDSSPCGPGSSCCPSGFICNIRRGIPACENLALPVISEFGGDPCNDPYLFSCVTLGLGNVCCPIGTVCFNKNSESVVSCIDAYGTTGSSYPSTTTGLVPSAAPIAIDDHRISYSPKNAWNNSTSVPDCTSEQLLRVTDVSNATVSFDYIGEYHIPASVICILLSLKPGPSIMIHTITSSQGGIFSVLVDGFNTTDIIDTYSGGNITLPVCYPVQFPPFIKPPPTLGTQNNHTITLVYGGPSPMAPNQTNSSSIQFASFAIPDFSKTLSSSAINSGWKRNTFTFLLTFFLSIIIDGYLTGVFGSLVV